MERNIEVLLCQKEVCALLGISAATLRRLRKTRKIAYISFGRHSIRFRQEDVRKFIERRHKAVDFARREAQKEAAALTFQGLRVAS